MSKLKIQLSLELGGTISLFVDGNYYINIFLPC